MFAMMAYVVPVVVVRGIVVVGVAMIAAYRHVYRFARAAC